ncbi:MAG: hypothetical protein CM1200mP10_25490 [Candidatus Neomarinimicrobiota bacterium]|nr:MAG: hypothetical protein CM1200mP10_25490 [Candidatus Neomarinimicrobiota bacterium]
MYYIFWDAESMVMTGMIMLMDGGMDMDNINIPTGVALYRSKTGLFFLCLVSY